MSTSQGLRRHRWNVAFSWPDHAGPFGYLDEARVRRFDQDGFLVLPGVFTVAELAPVVAELDALECRGRRLHVAGAEPGAHVAARSPLLARFVRHPALLGLCSDLVGPDVNLYDERTAYAPPGHSGGGWHQDNGGAFVDPQVYLTCWVALTDATEETGCPALVPGLHRLGTLEHSEGPLGRECFDEPPSAVSGAVAAGGVVVYSSLTPHRVGPNRTDAVRRSYVVQYAPAGAVRLTGEHVSGAPTDRVPQNDRSSQFPVLRGGQRVEG